VITDCLVLTQYRSVTDGRTDRRRDTSTMAKTREVAYSAVTRTNGCRPVVLGTDLLLIKAMHWRSTRFPVILTSMTLNDLEPP